MSSLVLELQLDVLNSSISTLDVLRKALVVAKKLDIEKFQKWIELELEGYDDLPVPKYRSTVGQLRAWNPYHGWHPIRTYNEEIQELYEKVCDCKIHQSISELIFLANAEGNKLVMHPSYLIEAFLVSTVKTSIEISISKISVQGVIEAVRNIILKWALQLEEDGVTGEGITFSIQEKQIVTRHDYSSWIQINLDQSQMQKSSSESQSKAEIFSNNLNGSVGGNVNSVQGNNNRTVQGSNNQAVLGDGNRVTQQQEGWEEIKALTKADILQLLTELESLVKEAKLPAGTKAEVIEDLSAAKTATDKEEPNKKRALDRLNTVAETLEKTSKILDAGQKIWKVAQPVLGTVATWLGTSAGSHLL